MLPGVTSIRERALRFVEEHNRHWRNEWSVEATITDAALVAAFWESEKPPTIRLRVGLVREQSDHSVVPHQPEGMEMQLSDTQEVDYTLAGKDAKGFDVTGEAFSATSSDETVVTVLQAGDIFTAVAGVPGSAVLTFSEAASGLSVTEAIDVVAGGVATISVTAGDVREQV